MEELFWAAVSLASGSSKVIPAESMSYVGGQLPLHPQGLLGSGKEHPSIPPSSGPQLQTLEFTKPLLPWGQEVRGQRGQWRWSC